MGIAEFIATALLSHMVVGEAITQSNILLLLQDFAQMIGLMIRKKIM